MVSDNVYYADVGLSHGFGLGTIAVVEGRNNLANTFFGKSQEMITLRKIHIFAILANKRSSNI